MFEYVIVNLLSIKEMKMILICFGRTLGIALHIDSCHVVIVPTKHIAYFLSSFLCLFSLFFYLYVGVPWP